MAIINASTSAGLVNIGDTDGTIKLQSNGVTEVTVQSTGMTVADNLLFNSGYGSAAIAYGCRAWVNFNGTGTVAIRASGNVSSITDNGTGDYTVNFTTALVDGNYCTTGTCVFDSTNNGQVVSNANSGGQTTTSVRIGVRAGFNLNDVSGVAIAIFR